ncbi:MAG: hypothetical protein DCC88_11560 [Spirobacillus cienkowskii]|uniref:Tetratricopeptide repeat protein n=1 Tax=Spirobacillus cienkowskii TaxID=495820 RepID=A0A369KTU4_9BACT|nr:MAG: hypothetical protein DCC88_11560 [Spirobacillus cienkowskii]
MVREYLGQRWFAWHHLTSWAIVIFFNFIFVFHSYSQSLLIDKAESFFYDKQYTNALEVYKNILENEYSSAKEKSIAKCRLAILNNNHQKISQSQTFLEESLKSNALPLSLNSICTYALIQVYVMQKNYLKAIELSKIVGFPNLQPIYLARFYALSAVAARFMMNSDFERTSIVSLLKVMKNHNFEYVEIDKFLSQKVSLHDLETRLIVLNHEKNIDSEFDNNYIENVFLLKIKNGDYQSALDILEKNLIKNEDSIIFDSGMYIKNSSLRGRLIHLINDNPLEMRIGIILANKKDRQIYNQNILRSISAFVNSSASQDVSYSFYIEEAKQDEGSLSLVGSSLIFDKKVHAIIASGDFKNNNDLISLSNFFSFPVIYIDKNDINPLKKISNNGSFKDVFEFNLNGKLKNLILESSVFDALIFLRNLHFLAGRAQSSELVKAMKKGNWNIDGISIYESFNQNLK